MMKDDEESKDTKGGKESFGARMAKYRKKKGRGGKRKKASR